MTVPPSYREVQAFRQIWMWLALALSAVPMWVIFIIQIVLGEPVGNRPGSDLMVVLFWLIFGVAFLYFFWYMALVTEVRGDGLSLRFRPFPGRRIAWSDITAAEAITYRPLRDFGGWGIRWGANGRRAYNVSGNRGVEITLTNGKRIVVGTQQPEHLHAAIIQALRRARLASDRA